MEEGALSMNVPKQKLAALDKFLSPDTPEVIYEFGRFLADYIPQPELVPMGFVLICETAIHDLQEGVNGFTNTLIQNRLIGHPPITYALLRMYIPRIADAILPQEFAAGVKAFVKEVEAEIEAMGE